MEFLKASYINTTTQISVNSNSTTAENIMNPDEFFQYYSDGLNNDATLSAITISFTETVLVSRIGIIDTNAKEFRIFYNGTTANTFSLTTTSTTTTSYWTGNSSSSLFIRTTPTYVTSVSINILSTQTANEEKRIGFMAITDIYSELSQLPNASGYDPKIVPKQIVHTLSDGGTRTHNVRKKWDVSIKLDFISQTQRDNLKTIYDLRVPFMFCPFGTATSWDSILFESVWVGPFEFYQYSDNASVSGFSGGIKLRETPS